jgi:hypothetical protein
MDTLWQIIYQIILQIEAALSQAFSLLHPLGPAVTIACAALLTAGVAGILRKSFITRRYQRLERDFRYWHGIRQQAAQQPDRDKGQLMAKNIDQAKLNKAYYDYFFEGLLNNLLTTYLPILCMLGFVNAAYSPQQLEQLFSRSCVFSLPTVQGGQFCFGAPFWFVLWVVLGFVLLVCGKRSLTGFKNRLAG